MSPRLAAVLQAVLVTFLWSTSWVLIKIGLRNDLPAISFAGVRYALAVLCLLPFVLLNPKYRQELKGLKVADWGMLSLLGLLMYTLTQSAQYLGLAYLPAATLNLVLNLTPAFVALSGFHTLGEGVKPLQWLGLSLCLIGVALYFLPLSLPGTQWFGIIFALVCLAGNVAASLLGRKVNRGDLHSPLIVTFVSMGIGSLIMLLVGLPAQGFGKPALQDWLIIVWLATINTAFAFTLWNHTLRSLSALESSIINGLMMPQIALLAFLFLGEGISARGIIGLTLVGLGALFAQLKTIQIGSRPEETVQPLTPGRIDK